MKNKSLEATHHESMQGAKKSFFISLERVSRLFWGLVLLSLPVTSFRFFPFLGQHTYVRPLAFYPLVLLYLILMLGVWRKEIRLPWSNAILPLFLFLIITLFTTATGALLAPIPMRGQEYWGRALRAFITFGIGLSFFIAALWMHRDQDDLRHSLKWLYAGLALTLLWVGIQAIALHTPLLTKGQVSDWQTLFSVRGFPKLKRVSGFAFEPSWLAGQIATLYLPWLVASLLMRFHVTKYRWLEILLLIGAIAALLLTYSRGGLIIAIAATGLTLLISGRNAISRGLRWFIRSSEIDRIYAFGVRAILLILIVSMAWGGISFLAQQNYVNRLWTVEADSLADYFVKTNAGGRITYLWAAAQIFIDHPWLGTGLGSSGLYLYQYFPDWALFNNPEIARHLSPTSNLFPNSKNLYLRLLAETGIFGFAIFGSFLLAILSQIGEAFRRSEKLIGIAGLSSFFAILIYYLMQDSFAMAELWINFGIVLGIASASLTPSLFPASEKGELQENL